MRCLILIVFALTFAAAQGAATSPATVRIQALEAALAKLTPASPGWASAQAKLALALATRARETADMTFYERAEAVLKDTLKQEPSNYEARRAKAWVLLGQHRFAEALQLAQALNERFPDDLMTYSMMVDAHIELGNYKQAEVAAQWLLDLRPGHVPGLTRAAYLRELFGDSAGSIELMRDALDNTPSQETEQRAWIMTQIGGLHLAAANLDASARFVTLALTEFPDYHYALKLRGRLYEARGETELAAAAYRAHYVAAPHPENLIDIARMDTVLGHASQARDTYDKFVQAARSESAAWDNANRQLAYYLSDHANSAADALPIIRREFTRRQDVYTAMTFAWVMFRNGECKEALGTARDALRIGVRDASLFYRAGDIEFACGSSDTALTHYEHALELAPWSERAPQAVKHVQRLSIAKGAATPVAKAG